MDRLTHCFLEVRADLLRFLTRRAGRAAAEDVAQDAWLNLRERGGDPGTWREPRAVVFTTAANLATDTQRREARAHKVLLRESAATEPSGEHDDPQTQLEARERLERLAAALEELPPACRDAFLLNRLEGLTHAEIADRLGVSTKSVQRYVERALRHCLQVLE